MEKRIRTLLIMVIALSCALVAAISVFLIALEIPKPWLFITISIVIILVTISQYLLVKSVAERASTYHDADYAAMLDSITGGVLVLDGKDNVYRISRRAREYLELPANPTGMFKSDIFDDEEMLRCIDSAKRGESSITQYTSRGVTLRVLVDPVIFSRRIVGTIILFLDMGEQLAIQRAKREFAATVSHELKTPLTSISGYAEMISSGLVEQKDVPEFAARIHAEAKRMLTLIGDIIRLSKLDEGEQTDAMEYVDMAEIADECSDVLLHSARQNSVTLTVDAEPCMVKGYRSLLSTLVFNLVDNAIRYNREGGSVIVTVRRDSLTVEDTGIGIPEEHQPHVFERFYRVDKSRSKQTGGTGLGLAIVKHIAEQVNADVILESSVGVGTTITVTFKPSEQA